MSTDEEQLRTITERIIGCAYRVANELGSGFLEKVYENALALELREPGLKVEQQVRRAVRYRGCVVGEFVADLVVEGVVIVELKAIESLDPIHSAQCINYLAATGMPACLLINFGRRVDVKRFVGPAFRSASKSPLP